MDLRRRAEQFRALACGTSDLSLKANYEALGRSYDELAEYLETTAGSLPAKQASDVAEQRSGGAGGEGRLH